MIHDFYTWKINSRTLNCFVTYFLLLNVAKPTHLLVRQDGQLFNAVILRMLSGGWHVTVIVLCNTSTVHVAKMIHLLTTELPRCCIFRQDGLLFNVVILC